MKAKFVNFYTDFGFKRLFGQEESKELLVDFLNAILPIGDKIVSVAFTDYTTHVRRKPEHAALIDLVCTDGKGARFVVEMQKAKLKFFRDRAEYYSTFPLREMVERGDWDFELKPVYCVAILDFLFDKERRSVDGYCHVHREKLHYIFVEMPRFKKRAEELTDRFEKWLYFLKHLETFEHIPDTLQDEVFIKGLEIARLDNFTVEQWREYEYSLKNYRELKAAIDTAREEGFKEAFAESYLQGIEEGRIKTKLSIARSLKQKNVSNREIADLTGLSPEEIDTL